MSNTLQIGMIGLDTSHCEAFTKLLNVESNEYHIPGGKVVAGYPGASSDFELSYQRVDKITNQLQEKYSVNITDSVEEAAEQSDAILLTSVDGRSHLEYFKKVVSYGKPIFIDKPFALSSEHAKKMFELADQHEVPLMSASALRYSVNLEEGVKQTKFGEIIGVDCFGPMNIQSTQPGLYWYGIHAVEMLYRTLGKGCLHVKAVNNENYEFVVGIWKDGRIGTIRGNRMGNKEFGASIHHEKETQFVHAHRQDKPLYAGLLENVMSFFETGQPDINPSETVEIIRFIEAANESRDTGEIVNL